MPYRLRELGPELLRELAREVDRLGRVAAVTRREHLAPLAVELDEAARRIAGEVGLAPHELDALAARVTPALLDEEHALEQTPSYAERAEAGDWELRISRLVLETCLALRADVARAAQPIEWRTSVGRPLFVAYDEARGRAAWRDEVGVWNPLAGAIEWRHEPERQLAGVFDPRRGAIEWRTREGGIAGVWNPDHDEIEWAEEGPQVRVAGVWNPAQRKVEWGTNHRGGVAGAFDVATQATIWRLQAGGAVACCWRDGETYRVSSSAFVRGGY